MLVSSLQTRSAARLALLVAEEHVETNPAYVPANGLTHCNAFAAAVCSRMCAPIPLILANDQHKALVERSTNPASGWELVCAHVAQRMSDEGQLAVASWANPSGGHGHIAILMPSLGEPGVWTAQAGAVNFTRDLIERGFGSIQPLFFVHP